MCHAAEYDEIPVRHNEDKLNTLLSQQVRWEVDPSTVSSPNTKTNLLLQAHMARSPLPISDYVTDTRTVLDNSIRILQAMVDISADAGWLDTCLTIMNLVQCIVQVCSIRPLKSSYQPRLTKFLSDVVDLDNNLVQWR